MAPGKIAATSLDYTADSKTRSAVGLRRGEARFGAELSRPITSRVASTALLRHSALACGHAVSHRAWIGTAYSPSPKLALASPS